MHILVHIGMYMRNRAFFTSTTFLFSLNLACKYCILTNFAILLRKNMNMKHLHPQPYTHTHTHIYEIKFLHWFAFTCANGSTIRSA